MDGWLGLYNADQGVTPEGETLSLIGSASSFWDVCELIFNKVTIKMFYKYMKHEEKRM